MSVIGLREQKSVSLGFDHRLFEWKKPNVDLLLK